MTKPGYKNEGFSNEVGGYWIGAYRSAETGQFKWVDNSAFTYTNWATNTPDNYFGKFENFAFDWYLVNELKYMGWNDLPHYYHLFVVCELAC